MWKRLAALNLFIVLRGGCSPLWFTAIALNYSHSTQLHPSTWLSELAEKLGGWRSTNTCSFLVAAAVPSSVGNYFLCLPPRTPPDVVQLWRFLPFIVKAIVVFSGKAQWLLQKIISLWANTHGCSVVAVQNMHWAGPDSRSGATNWNEAFRFRSRRQQRIFSRTSVCFRLIWSFNSDPLLLFLVFHSLLLLKAVPLVLCALRFFFVCMVPPPPERKRRFSDVCPFFFPFTQLFSRFFYLPGRGICFPSTFLFSRRFLLFVRKKLSALVDSRAFYTDKDDLVLRC